MASSHHKQIQNIEDSDLNLVIKLISKNYKLILSCIVVALVIAWLANNFMVPKYKVSSSLLLTEDTRITDRNTNEYLHSNLFQVNQNLQNELWVLKSAPVIEQTIKNLNLLVNYSEKREFKNYDAYGDVPFMVLLLTDHVQPVDVKFEITVLNNNNYKITAKETDIEVVDLFSGKQAYVKENWKFQRSAEFGELIETTDLAFVIKLNPDRKQNLNKNKKYNISFSAMGEVSENIKEKVDVKIVDAKATVIEIQYKTPSVQKGKDIVNELMNVYSQQNLDRKNHIAGMTINYIDKQLMEISDSLSNAEDSLQRFRSSHQLLDINQQTNSMTSQFMNLQNELAELLTRKRYYDYVAEYLGSNDDFSDMIVPASMGIPDQLLTNLMSELITAQTQRSNLVHNDQELNPLVSKLVVQIQNIKTTITKNIAAVRKTMEISINEMSNRIDKMKSMISRLPATQRQLGGIERKYKLNDAIYNYLLEKRAEAKITQASNMPDNIIIEPARMVGTHPVSPKKMINYLIALFLGFVGPLGYLALKNSLNSKIDTQDSIERITNIPILGKIMHHKYKNGDTLFEHPRSVVAESFRALRTNLEYQFKGMDNKVIMITSSMEGEGKSFNALNLAVSYSQLGYRTLLINFDLRKESHYFDLNEKFSNGIYAWYTENASFEDVVIHSPYDNLDYIQTGILPADPTHLLTVYNTGEKINELKSMYDCIILDTSPLAQVSDAYLLMDYADIKLVVARCNYSLSKVLSHVMKDLSSKKIDNLFVIMNDNRAVDEQYGYGYGYKQEDKKQFFKFN